MSAQHLLRAVRCALPLAALLAGTSCITGYRAQWYGGAQLQRGSGEVDVVSGERTVLEYERWSGLPAPDAFSKRRLLIELEPGALAVGSTISFPSATARALYAVLEGPPWRSAEASGTAVVLALDDAGVLVDYDARCAELGWQREGRERFVRAALPRQD